VKAQAIIATAGTGTRLNADVPKPMVDLLGKPICAHTIEAFERCPQIDSIIVVGHSKQLDRLQEIVERYRFQKVVKIVAGGEKRHESVANGIAALDRDTQIVVVHDGARPLVSRRLIEEAVKLCGTWDAVVAAVPVKQTVKQVDSRSLCVERTLDRSGLWEAQTPQVFKKSILEKAHAGNTQDNPTDDAVMVERLGVKVKIIEGDYRNIKITTREDLIVAEGFLKGAVC
jgi:2-C-methyl-D-erythritol 4-phosphate cytidylyltransferase